MVSEQYVEPKPTRTWDEDKALIRELVAAGVMLDTVFDFSEVLSPNDFDIEDTAFANEAFAKMRSALAHAAELGFGASDV